MILNKRSTFDFKNSLTTKITPNDYLLYKNFNKNRAKTNLIVEFRYLRPFHNFS